VCEAKGVEEGNVTDVHEPSRGLYKPQIALVLVEREPMRSLGFWHGVLLFNF